MNKCQFCDDCLECPTPGPQCDHCATHVKCEVCGQLMCEDGDSKTPGKNICIECAEEIIQSEEDSRGGIVKCPRCNREEYYDDMHWLDGSTLCRKCIYTVWEKSTKGHWNSLNEPVFPQ